MRKPFFELRHFVVRQDRCGGKVTSDACAFGALATTWMGNRPSRILDIGTGTGILAMLCAQRFLLKTTTTTTTTIIDAVEIDRDAAAQARDNAAAFFPNIKVHCNDALRFAPSNRYDAIVCNPPFFGATREAATRQRNLARHDTRLPPTGLLDTVSRLLEPRGVFCVLLGARFSEPRRAFCDLALQRGLVLAAAVEFADRPDSPPHVVAMAFTTRHVGPRRLVVPDRLDFFAEPGVGWRAPTPRLAALMADVYTDKYLRRPPP
ncbi:hypothetical protein CTAYLR_001351 [Chrysophaeum taylorii]|uniref:Methyltransferase small domain-containing protein n=1 Tax=Chrysophaeum taylorii TaxID=2483200 RepID=A0AAD7XHP5_9STRA|nr:hypothetical protein CTAYLR_001351 [Chrysophaeum taylorii]